MIIDVHTHLSTRQQWGRIFLEVIESGRAGHGTLDLNVTPERHWAAMEEASRAVVFGINSIALGMNTPNDDIAAYANAHPEKIIGFMSADPHARGLPRHPGHADGVGEPAAVRPGCT